MGVRHSDNVLVYYRVPSMMEPFTSANFKGKHVVQDGENNKTWCIGLDDKIYSLNGGTWVLFSNTRLAKGLVVYNNAIHIIALGGVNDNKMYQWK